MATDDIYKSKGRYERWIKTYIDDERYYKNQIRN